MLQDDLILFWSCDPQRTTLEREIGETLLFHRREIKGLHAYIDALLVELRDERARNASTGAA